MAEFECGFDGGFFDDGLAGILRMRERFEAEVGFIVEAGELGGHRVDGGRAHAGAEGVAVGEFGFDEVDEGEERERVVGCGGGVDEVVAAAGEIADEVLAVVFHDEVVGGEGDELAEGMRSGFGWGVGVGAFDAQLFGDVVVEEPFVGVGGDEAEERERDEKGGVEDRGKFGHGVGRLTVLADVGQMGRQGYFDR